MTIQLLLTDEIKATMPETIKILFNYGRIQVRFPALNGNDNEALMMFGDNAVLDGDVNEFVKWLKPFDGIAVGNGVPQMESFSIMHIDENL